MASTETLLACGIALALYAYIPGPAILYTVAQTIARGRRAGLMAAAGLHVGGYFHVFAASFGLSALLTYVPTLYGAIKIAGALYLIWLGISMIRAARLNETSPGIVPKTARRAFVESMLVEILNPKAALFFVAFLPQFADPAGAWPVSLQLFVLGVVTLLAFLSSDLVALYLASKITAGRGGEVQSWLRRVGGTLLVGLGVKLAMER